MYPLTASTEDVMSFSLNLRSMINFESPRFLIQEVSQTLIQMQTASDSYVEEYFSRAIDLFKDDSSLNQELKQVLATLP